MSQVTCRASIICVDTSCSMKSSYASKSKPKRLGEKKQLQLGVAVTHSNSICAGKGAEQGASGLLPTAKACALGAIITACFNVHA